MVNELTLTTRKILPVEPAWHVVVVLEGGVGSVAPTPQILLLEESPLESLKIKIYS